MGDIGTLRGGKKSRCPVIGFPGSSTAKALMHRSSLPEDRLLSQDLKGLADGQLIDWTS